MVNPDPRSRLLKAAIRLLATHGPTEIKARSVSSEAGLSTMGVYTHFGGVSELLQAVAEEGFRQQADIFRQVANTQDAMTDLCAIALACRDFAMRNAHLYDLMFGLSIQGRYGPVRGESTTAPKVGADAFMASYSHLRGGCERLIKGNCVRQMEPDLMAAQLWSTLHGFILLELGGHFAATLNPPIEILVPMCINLVVGLGADRERAKASAAIAVADWASRQCDTKSMAQFLNAVNTI
ncbi:transcriptional regulator, TetR family [Rhodoferax ferrireducens T118]|uniref:Transcriptional regulator, TetR family n=1 Tax=Albidiferax ferrireducens (strain ATCC BAA-621 / DSM 15236 / T118) TaxID=338969 RepID=Q222H4_ALBFT|nr:TetR/AcrR family transcriptional regulator [Rhodoferax ferrireducens]ABD68079.1 transcriptional regulator, TetR family [Rhodoferax ferrireducens T118]